MKTFSRSFLEETKTILDQCNDLVLEKIALGLADLRTRGGRLFILGVGGSAGHAGHAVNDFRKICGIESYAPTDNVSELTARINDEGWESCFEEWLKISRLSHLDALLVFSVGGGHQEKKISVNLIRAIDYARSLDASVFGIVGKDGGHLAKQATAAVVIPPLFDSRITPHTEGICAVLWHLLVSHPVLQAKRTKWESVSGREKESPLIQL